MSTGSESDAEDTQDSPPLRSSRQGLGSEVLYICAEHSEDEQGTEDTYGKTKGVGSASGGKQRGCKEGRMSQRNAANARERARMRVLSKAFSRLKTSLPWVPADTKLSKLDTLRLASSYISHLRRLLQNDQLESGFVHPMNLTWPFGSGRSEDNKEIPAAARLCGATA